MGYLINRFHLILLALILLAVTCFIKYSNGYIMIDVIRFSSRTNNPLISCDTLDVEKLNLLTFDLFGALMLTEESLHENIANILPFLSNTDVEKFTTSWLNAYASYFGKSFPPSLTKQPFRWIIESSLIDILSSFGLSEHIPPSSITFEALLETWGNLKPRDGVIDVLTTLNQKYQIGILSNGDVETLEAAISIFPRSVNISFILSSDYPVNCLKPCPGMYAQALAAVGGDVAKVLHVAGSAFDAKGAMDFGIFSGAIDPAANQSIPKPCFALDDIRSLPSFFHL